MPDAPEPPRDSAIPSTREELIRAAAALREEAARILEEAKENASARVAVAAAYERLAGVRERIGLNTRVDSDTVNAMDASGMSSNAQRSDSRVAYKDNAFIRAKAAKNETIRDVSTLLEDRFHGKSFHQNTIQGWYVPVGKKSHRDCPLEVREFLRDHYGKFTSGEHKGAWRVPLDSWPLERGR